MRRGMTLVIISTLCGASLLVAVPALAQGAPAQGAPASATTAYQAGVTHFEARRFGQALAAFEQALIIAPQSAVLVFNIARTLEELRAIDPAVEQYQRYLRMRPDADDAQAVRAAIDRLRGAVASLTPASLGPAAGALTVTSTPVGATVFVDGRPAGQTPLALTTAAGVHYVTISKDGFSRASREVTVVDGQSTAHAATLVPTTQITARGEDDLAGWMLVGFGSTLLIGGSVFGALALDQDARLDAIEAGDRRATRDEFNTAQDTGRLYAYLADGLLIGGLAAAVTGGIVLLTDDTPTVARDSMAWNF
ncbi:MAG: tetratricopeptide (TPR) repeat protein [Bradymonadia bacterium]|jgi:tetratricopeptide (TPR) repeat protein